jgi:isopenicillin N synthase-like dioxygenase
MSQISIEPVHHSKTTIQTLDITDWTGQDSIEQKGFVLDLKRAFTDIGFVIIKGHDVSAELQERAYRSVDKFFKLPVEKKKTYHKTGIGGQRGYTSFGVEHSKDNPVGDLKEFFQYGPTIPADYPTNDTYCENVSVPEIAGFDETMGELFRRLNALGMDVLRAIAVIVEQDEHFFTDKVRYGNSKLRAIHYPPLRGDEAPGAVRSAEHEDINLITLLIGASSPGLQVKAKTGEWIPLQTKENEIVVNVGDMLQRLTNYKLKSTTHRVVNPASELATTNRYSLPFFLHPVSDMSLAALATCVTPNNPARDPATTADEYLNERLKQNGMK